MGGFGSGNWGLRFDSKTTVEDCVRLSVGMLPSYVWMGGRATFEVPYAIGPPLRLQVELDPESRTALRLYFSHGDAKWRQDVAIDQPERSRRWFRCPLVKANAVCGKRAGTLYMPPGEAEFGCRACYDLTYESRQRGESRAEADDAILWLAVRFGSELEAAYAAIAQELE